jgi:hypothetical protein
MSLQKRSEKQKAASRENAKKSTGPRTPQGKAVSSRNAVKHGLTAKDITVLGEDYTEMPGIRQDLLDSWDCKTKHELYLIERLAAIRTRLNRMTRMETGLFDQKIPDVTADVCKEAINAAVSMAFVGFEKSFEIMSRYEARLARMEEATLRQLIALRKELRGDPSPTRPTHYLAPIVQNALRNLVKNDKTNPPPDENKEPGAGSVFRDPCYPWEIENPVTPAYLPPWEPPKNPK